MDDINFNSYTQKQLQESLGSIDKEKYPENYERLISELKNREKNPPISETKNEQKDKGFSPIKNLADVLNKMYIALIFMAVIALYSQFLEVDLISSAKEGLEYTIGQGVENDSRQMIVGLIQFFLTIVTFIIFLIWLFRSYRNLKVLGLSDSLYSPGFVIGGFFIPFMNLYVPYKAIKEIWEWCNPKSLDPQGGTSKRILAIWWFLFATQNYIGNLILKASSNTETIGEIHNLSIATLVSDAIDLPFIILELLVVKTITEWQLVNYKNLKLNSQVSLG